MHRQADEATIKRAYRKLALKMHPDKVQGNEEDKKRAAEKFAEVSHGKNIRVLPMYARITSSLPILILN